MDLDRIVAELKQERGRLEQAIAALEGVGRGTPIAKRSEAKTGNKRGGMSATTKKRLSDAMKKSWAARKRKSA